LQIIAERFLSRVKVNQGKAYMPFLQIADGGALKDAKSVDFAETIL
jgi:hypothetical protein